MIKFSINNAGTDTSDGGMRPPVPPKDKLPSKDKGKGKMAKNNVTITEKEVINPPKRRRPSTARLPHIASLEKKPKNKATMTGDKVMGPAQTPRPPKTSTPRIDNLHLMPVGTDNVDDEDDMIITDYNSRPEVGIATLVNIVPAPLGPPMYQGPALTSTTSENTEDGRMIINHGSYYMGGPFDINNDNFRLFGNGLQRERSQTERPSRIDNLSQKQKDVMVGIGFDADVRRAINQNNVDPNSEDWKRCNRAAIAFFDGNDLLTFDKADALDEERKKTMADDKNYDDLLVPEPQPRRRCAASRAAGHLNDHVNTILASNTNEDAFSLPSTINAAGRGNMTFPTISMEDAFVFPPTVSTDYDGMSFPSIDNVISFANDGNDMAFPSVDNAMSFTSIGNVMSFADDDNLMFFPSDENAMSMPANETAIEDLFFLPTTAYSVNNEDTVAPGLLTLPVVVYSGSSSDFFTPTIHTATEVRYETVRNPNFIDTRPPCPARNRKESAPITQEHVMSMREKLRFNNSVFNKLEKERLESESGNVSGNNSGADDYFSSTTNTRNNSTAATSLRTISSTNDAIASNKSSNGKLSPLPTPVLDASNIDPLFDSHQAITPNTLEKKPAVWVARQMKAYQHREMKPGSKDKQNPLGQDILGDRIHLEDPTEGPFHVYGTKMFEETAEEIAEMLERPKFARSLYEKGIWAKNKRVMDARLAVEAVQKLGSVGVVGTVVEVGTLGIGDIEKGVKAIATEIKETVVEEISNEEAKKTEAVKAEKERKRREYLAHFRNVWMPKNGL